MARKNRQRKATRNAPPAPPPSQPPGGGCVLDSDELERKTDLLGYWDEAPLNRTNRVLYQLSSSKDTPEDAPDYPETMHAATLAGVFIDHSFPNLTSAVMSLVEKRNLQIVVSGHLLGNGAENYLDAEYDPKKCKRDVYQLCAIDVMSMLAVGTIEQLMVAGLQLVYKAGRKDRSFYSYYEAKNTVNVRVDFSFNSKPVHLCLLQHKSTTKGVPWLMLTTTN